IPAEDWQTAHVYLFGKKAAELVAADARVLLGQQVNEYRRESEMVKLQMSDQTVIKAIPRLDGFEFNPPYQLVGFREAWHRMDFRLRGSLKCAGKASNGAVSIMINGVFVCDIPVSIYVSSEAHVSLPIKQRDSKAATQTYRPYQSIFCSYSHRDL